MGVKISISALVNKDVQEVWEAWTDPGHIRGWNFANDEWYCPRAENDLRTGGSFSSRMEARDGSAGFDFTGTYDQVIGDERIEYTLEDGRKVKVHFADRGGATEISESFEAEASNPPEIQQAGWQAILDNFVRYTESL